MSWVLALSEIAEVCRLRIAVREAGFGDEALNYPRDDRALKAICAFNNCPVEKAPAGWRYFPNAGTRDAWTRVVEALA